MGVLLFAKVQKIKTWKRGVETMSDEIATSLSSASWFRSDKVPSEYAYTDLQHRNLADNPLYYLAQEEMLLNQQLASLASRHRALSQNGMSSTGSVRASIESCFRKLELLYQSKYEIYSREATDKLGLLGHLNQLEEDKKSLRDKIELVYSKNSESVRLKQLEAKEAELTSEINALEHRLQQLKESRTVLQNEITQSKSILESRTSSLIESIDEINSLEQNIIEENHIYKDAKDMRLVLEIIQLEINSVRDEAGKNSLLRDNFRENCIIWKDVSMVLSEFESSLAQLLSSAGSSSTTDKEAVKAEIEKLLMSTKNDLLNRKSALIKQDHHPNLLKSLFDTEISTLDSGIELILGKSSASTPSSASGTPSTNTKPKLLSNVDYVSSSPPQTTLISSSGNFTNPSKPKSKKND